MGSLARIKVSILEKDEHISPHASQGGSNYVNKVSLQTYSYKKTRNIPVMQSKEY
jgi:hypothetical protein